MLRFILAVIFLICFLIVSIPIWLVELVVRHFNPMAAAKSSQWIVNKAFKIIVWFSGAKVIVKGLENVPKDTPVLYVANHRSYFDIAICYPLVKNSTGFISKKEMKKFLGVNVWMWFMQCQFLDRENIKEGLKTVLHCIDLVKGGTSIFICPEGTRNSTDTLLPFKEGSLKIAEKTGCPVIPVAITNTDGIFEKQMPRMRPVTAIIEFCAPIYLKELPKDQQKHAGSYIRDILSEKLAENAPLVDTES